MPPKPLLNARPDQAPGWPPAGRAPGLQSHRRDEGPSAPARQQLGPWFLPIWKARTHPPAESVGWVLRGVGVLLPWGTFLTPHTCPGPSSSQVRTWRPGWEDSGEEGQGWELVVSRPGREGGQGWPSFYSTELLPHVWTGPGSDDPSTATSRHPSPSAILSGHICSWSMRPPALVRQAPSAPLRPDTPWAPSVPCPDPFRPDHLQAPSAPPPGPPPTAPRSLVSLRHVYLTSFSYLLAPRPPPSLAGSYCPPGLCGPRF